MKKIFIMNLGTTSFKFKLYSFSESQQQVLASGEIESVGAAESAYDLQLGEDKKIAGKTKIVPGYIAVLNDGDGKKLGLCLDAGLFGTGGTVLGKGKNGQISVGFQNGELNTF